MNTPNARRRWSGRGLSETARYFEEKITNLDRQLSEEIRELRQQLLEHSKTPSGEIKDKHDQLKAVSISSNRSCANCATASEDRP